MKHSLTWGHGRLFYSNDQSVLQVSKRSKNKNWVWGCWKGCGRHSWWATPQTFSPFLLFILFLLQSAQPHQMNQDLLKSLMTFPSLSYNDWSLLLGNETKEVSWGLLRKTFFPAKKGTCEKSIWSSSILFFLFCSLTHENMMLGEAAATLYLWGKSQENCIDIHLFKYLDKYLLGTYCYQV